MARLFQVKPCYEAGPLAKRPMAEVDAAMAIGDEALCMKQAQAMPFELDLGAAWQELTGLPFVFGVWAVRRAFAETQPEATGSLHRLLLRSKTWGLGALPELSRLAAASFNMTPEQVLAYFHQLDYALGPDHERGLRTFFHYLHEQGELAEEPRLEYFQEIAISYSAVSFQLRQPKRRQDCGGSAITDAWTVSGSTQVSRK